MSVYVSLLVAASVVAQADDPFAAGVRPTEPLSPDAQQKAFHLPPGFEIQLFASEPDLQKPMNMAFDAAGRLWVSGSVEYPYAAQEGEGRDCIRVLEDSNGDGRADRITTFADGLNIPIGLYPYRNGVVAYSIPNIWFFADDDGDGRADRREILYGPLGQPRDTHGMQNAFRRGFDGWLYVLHGFSNESTITAKDGSSITLQSGNSYRVRLDGSRVEQFTWGQVNPFGGAFTAAGDFVNADCHSTPLTRLIRGGYFPSFGKPHDGLGFVAPLMQHTHGSTAICAVAIPTGDSFPPEYRERLFVGNVMSSRVHCDRIEWSGATMRAIEEPDFITCDDPWFRPVDLQFGPDGALYIADFYNRIIGHYEVPLDHPGRDRDRARIWRVTYRGDRDVPSTSPPVRTEGSSRRVRLATAEFPKLIESLGDDNLTVRMLAADQIADRVAVAAAAAGRVETERLNAALKSAAGDTSNAPRRAHAIWLLARFGGLDDELLSAAANDRDSLVRTHAMRIAAERPDWSDAIRQQAIQRLANDEEPSVRRAAAEAIGLHAHAASVEPLIAALQTTTDDDPHFRQTIRIALRNLMRHEATLTALASREWPAEASDILASVLPAVPGEASANLAIDWLNRFGFQDGRSPELLAHAARYVPTSRMDELVELAERQAGDDVPRQRMLVELAQQSLARRGTEATPRLKAWGTSVARKLFESAERAGLGDWRNMSAANPWGLEPRACADGQRDVRFLSSLPGGESQTATLRSRPFALPESLSFYLCGHRGLPGQPASDANFVQVRLVDSAEPLARAFPPRNDTAQQVRWEFAEHVGKQAVVEIVDGLELNAYAWLAVARFEPAVLHVPELSPREASDRRAAAAQIAANLRIEELREPLRAILVDESMDPAARSAAASALVSIDRRSVFAAAPLVIAYAGTADSIRNQFAASVAESDESKYAAALQAAMKSVAASQQQALAEALAGSAESAELLLAMTEKGQASPRLLNQPAVRQKLLASLPKAESRVEKLTADLPSLSNETAAILLKRLVEFRAASESNDKPLADRGRPLFVKHCAACHRIANEGGMIGPQLDGVGLRGADRLIEDVIDPSRNVDVAFHTAVLILVDGRVVTGLPRREEGKSLVLANAEGKEFSVPLDDIEERRDSPLSLMPAGFGENLSAREFADLIAYLASLREMSK